MKKHVLKIITATLVGAMALSFTACSSSTSVDSSSGGNGIIKLSMWHQSVGDTDPTSKLLKEAVEEWNKEHPDIIVEQDGVTGEQYKTKIKTAIAANEGPDIEYICMEEVLLNLIYNQEICWLLMNILLKTLKTS